MLDKNPKQQELQTQGLSWKKHHRERRPWKITILGHFPVGASSSVTLISALVNTNESSHLFQILIVGTPKKTLSSSGLDLAPHSNNQQLMHPCVSLFLVIYSSPLIKLSTFFQGQVLVLGIYTFTYSLYFTTLLPIQYIPLGANAWRPEVSRSYFRNS